MQQHKMINYIKKKILKYIIVVVQSLKFCGWCDIHYF